MAKAACSCGRTANWKTWGNDGSGPTPLCSACAEAQKDTIKRKEKMCNCGR